jgi:hypothetical protein
LVAFGGAGVSYSWREAKNTTDNAVVPSFSAKIRHLPIADRRKIHNPGFRPPRVSDKGRGALETDAYRPIIRTRRGGIP